MSGCKRVVHHYLWLVDHAVSQCRSIVLNRSGLGIVLLVLKFIKGPLRNVSIGEACILLSADAVSLVI